MSEHDDTELDDFMDGKSSLNEIYRKGKQEEPSAELDARILAAASEAVGDADHAEAPHQSTSIKRPGWLVPLSVAATVMLGVNLAYNLKDFSSTPEFEANGPTVMTEGGNDPAVSADQGTDADFLEDRIAQMRKDSRREQRKSGAQAARQITIGLEPNTAANAPSQESGDLPLAESTPETTQPASPSLSATSNADQVMEDVVSADSGMGRFEPEEAPAAKQSEQDEIVVTGSRIRGAELESAAPQVAAAEERAYYRDADAERDSKERRKSIKSEAEEAQALAETERAENTVAAFSPPPAAAIDTAAAPLGTMASRNATASGVTDYYCHRRSRADGQIDQLINSKAPASAQQAQLWLSEISALAASEQAEIACLELEAFARRYGQSAIPEDFPVHLPD